MGHFKQRFYPHAQRGRCLALWQPRPLHGTKLRFAIRVMTASGCPRATSRRRRSPRSPARGALDFLGEARLDFLPPPERLQPKQKLAKPDHKRASFKSASTPRVRRASPRAQSEKILSVSSVSSIGDFTPPAARRVVRSVSLTASFSARQTRPSSLRAPVALVTLHPWTSSCRSKR